MTRKLQDSYILSKERKQNTLYIINWLVRLPLR